MFLLWKGIKTIYKKKNLQRNKLLSQKVSPCKICKLQPWTSGTRTSCWSVQTVCIRTLAWWCPYCSEKTKTKAAIPDKERSRKLRAAPKYASKIIGVCISGKSISSSILWWSTAGQWNILSGTSLSWSWLANMEATIIKISHADWPFGMTCDPEIIHHDWNVSSDPRCSSPISPTELAHTWQRAALELSLSSWFLGLAFS